MNARAALITSMALAFAMFLFAASINTWRDQLILEHSFALFEKQASVYLRQVTETLRNDLIQENLRTVRNRLSSLQQESLFTEYAIYRGSELVEQSANFSALQNDSRYFLTITPVEFIKDSGKAWGDVRYLTSDKELRSLNSSLSSGLLIASSLIAFLTALATLLLLWMFWQSVRFLLAYIRASLDESNLPSNELASWIWGPLLQLTSKLIREHKRASQSLEQARMAEEISMLAAQVAHDIRSPLSALKIAAAAGERTPEVNHLITHATERIDHIASELLSAWKRGYSRKLDTSGNATVPKQPSPDLHQLDKLIESVVTEFKFRFQSLVKMDFDREKAPCFAKVDAVGLQRVLSNLINNSVEATSKSADAKVTVFLRNYRSTFTISVVDNGCGIPKDLVTKIGEVGVSSGKDGHGLGVSFAKKFAEDHGGSMNIQSSENNGTMVTINLPKS